MTIETATKPRRQRLVALGILLVGGLAAVGLATLKPAPRTMPVREAPPPQVAVAYAEPRDQALTVQSQGTVQPRREIDLVVQVSGQVKSVNPNFVDGGFVQAGELLLEIDARDYQLALTRAEARVAEARQLLATEQARARQAEREWRDLGNTAANDLFLRKPQLAAAEAQLEAAVAERDKAELDLQRTKVSVPFDGRIRETFVDLGQYVTPGGRVARVYDTAVAEIRLPLTDRQAALVELPLGFRGDDANPGPSVLISGIVAGERYQWQGRIVRTDASLDTNSRMFYAVAEVADPFLRQPEKARVPLVIGLFVNAEISGREIANLVTLPRQALFNDNHIYTLDAANRVQEKTVRVFARDPDHAWVRGDLASGEAVIVGGQSFLRPGMTVNPHPLEPRVAKE